MYKESTASVAFTYRPGPKVPEGFVLVEAGSFRMGSELSPREIASKYGGEASWYEDERPVHTVRITRDFYMSKYEVMVGEFRQFVSETGYRTTAEREGGVWVWTGSKLEKKADANWRNPYFRQGSNEPVVCVSWYDAVEYCNWLSRKEGLTPAYNIRGKDVTWNRSANGYRLPTEAEWEYAARGGNKGRGYIFAGSNYVDEVVWYWDNSGEKTHPVGRKKANELDIYDNSGNVGEWVWDRYDSDYYSSSPASDPAGPYSGADRVMRGGGWYNDARCCRSADRGGYNSADRIADLGFRVVRLP